VATATRRAGKGQGAAPPGEVRIIGGRLRHRRLSFPSLPGLRPTSDRVRETLFNWLVPYLPGARCLDLFAGSGALGIEAASRGAAAVVLVEQAPAAVAALRQNIDLLQVVQAQVVPTDALEYLARPPSAFDIVFVDPPYASDLLQPCIDALESRQWLTPGGLVYIEAASEQAWSLPANWTLLRSKRAGQVGYHLAKKQERSMQP
jgi:16S rRNA (guanine966-N2)-methyltransferase